MELGAVNCLPDGDPAMSLICHRIPSHPKADRKAAGRLGGRPPWDARGRHLALMRAVLNRCLQGGIRGAHGSDFSQPGAQGKAADGAAVNQREGDGKCTTAHVAVHKDRGDGDGGAVHQSTR